MPIQLIYHRVDSVPGQVSIFDQTIVRITQNQDIKIVCPYLGITYLKAIIFGCKSWRLITDIEEWIASQNGSARQEIYNFILQHSSLVHHYKDLHAKAIVSSECALVGSANFTAKGITGRTEMSVLFEQTEQVKELNQWFEDLWIQTEEVKFDELKKLLSTTQLKLNVPVGSNKFTLTSKASAIKTKLIQRAINNSLIGFKNKIVPTQESYQRLIDCLKFFPSKDFINTYFDLIKELIEFTGVQADDPRLLMSIPKSFDRLPVTINNRYAISYFFKKNVIGFIVGSDFDGIEQLKSESVKCNQYKASPGEDPLKTPYDLDFKSIPEHNNFKDAWKKAVLVEFNRRKRSLYHGQGWHERIIYDVAIDLDYRESIINAAFPTK